jgi:hypothetical protein
VVNHALQLVESLVVSRIHTTDYGCGALGVATWSLEYSRFFRMQRLVAAFAAAHARARTLAPCDRSVIRGQASSAWHRCTACSVV